MNRRQFLVLLYSMLVTQSLYFASKALALDYTNLSIDFVSMETLSERPKHRDFTRWIESMYHLNLNPIFEATSSYGFIANETQVRYAKNIGVLDQSFLKTASAQRTLFPNVNFYQCNATSCRASQDVGPLLPTARYISHYQWISIANYQELTKLQIPLSLFHDGINFPKYLILQLATDWSQFFYRASSISVFEPNGMNDQWIYISSYQTVSLTRFGTLGKGSIQTTLEEQIHDFLDAFGKL